jgi:hypothetical protein
VFDENGADVIASLFHARPSALRQSIRMLFRATLWRFNESNQTTTLADGMNACPLLKTDYSTLDAFTFSIVIIFPLVAFFFEFLNAVFQRVTDRSFLLDVFCMCSVNCPRVACASFRAVLFVFIVYRLHINDNLAAGIHFYPSH